MKRQARKLLTEVERDETALVAARAIVVGELADEPVTQRDPAVLREALAVYHDRYERADLAVRNRLNRALCAAIGSHPRVYRIGKPKSRWSVVEVRWPELEAEGLRGRPAVLHDDDAIVRPALAKGRKRSRLT